MFVYLFLFFLCPVPVIIAGIITKKMLKICLKIFVEKFTKKSLQITMSVTLSSRKTCNEISLYLSRYEKSAQNSSLWVNYLTFLKSKSPAKQKLLITSTSQN